MSPPRRVVAGTTYLLTRRCAQRCYFLRPSPLVTDLFGYLLAWAAKESGILVHAALVHVNHVHLVVTDPDARLPVFMHALNSLLARALNHEYGRSENFWAPGSYSAVELPSEDEVLDKILYVHTNVTKDGMVSDPSHWPGFLTQPRSPGRTRTYRRPRISFFSERTALPNACKLTITRPPAFADYTDTQYTRLLARAQAEYLDLVKAKRLQEGKNSYLGPTAVCALNPRSCPDSADPTPSGSPVIACCDPAERKRLLQQLSDWRQAYREAWKAWCAGVRDVLFPLGTYAMRIYHHVSCAPPSPG